MAALLNLILRRLTIIPLMVVTLLMVSGLFSATYVLASSTSNFQQTVNAGTLAVDIVDASYVTVGSPSVTMGAVTFAFTCQTATGSFGSASQVIYVSNPDAADNGWVVSLAGFATPGVWGGGAAGFCF